MLDDSLKISLQTPLCTSILTFAPQFWHLVKILKNGHFWRPKKGIRCPKKKTSPESILVWTFCKKPDPNWSNLAPVALFTFYSSLYGVATLYPVSAPKYQRDRVQQCTIVDLKKKKKRKDSNSEPLQSIVHPVRRRCNMRGGSKEVSIVASNCYRLAFWWHPLPAQTFLHF